MPTAESLRIASIMNAQEVSVGVGVATAQLTTADNTRKKLILTPPVAGQRYTVSAVPAVLDQGLTIVGGNPPIVIDDETYGTLASAALNVIGSAAMTILIYKVTTTAG